MGRPLGPEDAFKLGAELTGAEEALQGPTRDATIELRAAIGSNIPCKPDNGNTRASCTIPRHQTNGYLAIAMS